MRLFSEKGYEKTTMRAISKEAKLGLGALYYYFPSKEAIIISFYEQLQQEIKSEWANLDEPGQDLSDRLKAFLLFKFSKLEPYRPLLKVLLKEAVDPESAVSPLSSDSQGALDTSLSIFSEMLGPGENTQQIARFLWLGNMALIGLWLHRPNKIARAIDTFADLAPFLAATLANGQVSELLDDLLTE